MKDRGTKSRRGRKRGRVREREEMESDKKG
jgi:hypothetical protein